jgi:hypothetical protein
MYQVLKLRLREHGLDVDLLATSPVLAGLPQVNRALYVCKDTKGAIALMGVPETAWHFEGVIYLVDQVMILIDKNVASDWGIG